MGGKKITNISITSKGLAEEYTNLNKENHMFLFIHSNGCGHCNNMKPEWEKLKNKTELSKHNVIIADIEAVSANMLPGTHGYINEGYPTLKLIKMGGTSQKLYDGERTADAMSNFIMEELRENKKMTGGSRNLSTKTKIKKTKTRKTKTRKQRRVHWSKHNSVRIISPRKKTTV
jgi:hypothetical protein